MCYVYVLLSLKDRKLYTGYTRDLKARINEHVNGRVASTRARRPLKLIYYEACLSQSDALHREKYLKKTWGKRYLKTRLKSGLESR